MKKPRFGYCNRPKKQKETLIRLGLRQRRDSKVNDVMLSCTKLETHTEHSLGPDEPYRLEVGYQDPKCH
jgi:hypothetical protein